MLGVERGDMDDVYIAEHALRHGLSEEDIRFAWENFLRRQYRGAPHEGEVVVVGCDRRGRLIQMVGIHKPFGTLVYHAILPQPKSSPNSAL